MGILGNALCLKARIIFAYPHRCTVAEEHWRLSLKISPRKGGKPEKLENPLTDRQECCSVLLQQQGKEIQSRLSAHLSVWQFRHLHAAKLVIKIDFLFDRYSL